MAVVFLVLLGPRARRVSPQPVSRAWSSSLRSRCVFLVGLLLIPVGAWWTRDAGAARRSAARLAGHRPARRPAARHRRWRSCSRSPSSTCVIVSVGVYGGVHYMESADVLRPGVPHDDGAAGGGASGVAARPRCRARSVTSVPGPVPSSRRSSPVRGSCCTSSTGRVPRPVPSPADLIQSAERHLRSSATRPDVRTARSAARRSATTRTTRPTPRRTTTLRLQVGDRVRPVSIGTSVDGASSTWPPTTRGRRFPHRAASEAGGAGARSTWRRAQTATRRAGGATRRMDCTDCHNRPAHTFSSTPQRAVDAAHRPSGRIPRELPFVRREAVAAMAADDRHARGGARGASPARSERVLSQSRRRRPALVDRAVAGAQEAWVRNVFPGDEGRRGARIRIISATSTAPGCFRCHDDRHKRRRRPTITQECELCHTIPE